MQSLNLGYIFDKTYDIYLAVKYIYYFHILEWSQDKYYKETVGGKTGTEDNWDGLYHRGLLDQLTIIDKSNNPAFNNANDNSFIFSLLKEAGYANNKDSDNDGIPDIADNKPFDSNNLSNLNIKEIFYNDLGIADKIYDWMGFNIPDIDKDGLPDSYEEKISTGRTTPDTDMDGLFDGQEVFSGTSPLSPDSDGDEVIDGLDIFPLDRNISAVTDTDNDGVDDRVENYIGMNPYNRDTDMDGILDGVDIYPVNSANIPKLDKYLQVYKNTFKENTLSVQNSFLSSATDVVIVIIMFLMPVLFIMIYKLYRNIEEEFSHYYHSFAHTDVYKEVFGDHNDKKHAENKDTHKDHHTDSKIHLSNNSNSHHTDNNTTENTVNHSYNDNNSVNELDKDIDLSVSEKTHSVPPPGWLPGDEDDNNLDNKIHLLNNSKNKNDNITETVKVLTQKELEWRDKWKEVLQYVKEDNPVFWKIAIIEADSILESMLYDRGYSGKSMSDRLKSANFRTIDYAWTAHKVRNKLAHNNGTVTKRQAKEAMQSYSAVFKEFGISE